MGPASQRADASSCHRRLRSRRRHRETGAVSRGPAGRRGRRPAANAIPLKWPLSGHRRWFGVTMGAMSASDAAPLPRLGEVFFDVRGNSRSMRLSWYADTGVAVLSIWQGGMCTGTFRVPIADLPRLVDALQRGPQGASRGGGELPSNGASPVQRHDEAARIADDPP